MASITRFKGMSSPTGSTLVGIAGDGVLQMDSAITIGQLTIPLNNAALLTNATLTDNNAGINNNPDFSINVAAGQVALINVFASEYMKQITSFLSANSVPAVNNSGVYADGSGDTPPAKGTKITSFELAYSVVGGGGLTSMNFRADLVTFKNATANSIASFVANGQNGLVLAVTANATTCNLVTIPVASPSFDAVDNTALYLKIALQTPGGCTFRLYNIAMNFTFNYL